MRYLVPQFIEREIKVVGPLTFKQFLFFLMAAFVCLFWWALFYHTRFLLFVFLCVVTVGIGGALSFVKYHGVPLPELILNFFGYFLRSKKYVWQKKAIVDQPYQIPQYVPEKEEEPEPPLQRGSRLEGLSTQIEIES